MNVFTLVQNRVGKVFSRSPVSGTEVGEEDFRFFLLHLINKDQSDYTGQETFIRELYDQRNWEWFPVGESFLKQYEDVLMASS